MRTLAFGTRRPLSAAARGYNGGRVHAPLVVPRGGPLAGFIPRGALLCVVPRRRRAHVDAPQLA